MYYAIAAIVGILLGVFFTVIAIRGSKAGILKVYIPDHPDEHPYLYVELTRHIESIYDKGQVLFTVDVRNLKTQK